MILRRDKFLGRRPDLQHRQPPTGCTYARARRGRFENPAESERALKNHRGRDLCLCTLQEQRVQYITHCISPASIAVAVAAAAHTVRHRRPLVGRRHPTTTPAEKARARKRRSFAFVPLDFPSFVRSLREGGTITTSLCALASSDLQFKT